MWSYYNILLDQGIDIDANDINEFSDHMLYELSQHMSIEDIAKKFYNTTSKEIRNRILNHVERLATLGVSREIKNNG